MDLFTTPELIPNEVHAILNSFDTDGDPIKENQRIINELKPLGYTFDFDLGGEPYNLHKIKPIDKDAALQKAVKAYLSNECQQIRLKFRKTQLSKYQTKEREEMDKQHRISEAKNQQLKADTCRELNITLQEFVIALYQFESDALRKC